MSNELALFHLSFEDGSTETVLGFGFADAFWEFSDRFGSEDLNSLLFVERSFTFPDTTSL